MNPQQTTRGGQMPTSSDKTDQNIDSETGEAADLNAHPPPFGELIKFWRSTLGYSQQQLAAKISTTPRHISFLETGRSQPIADMVERLSKALELDELGHNTLMSAAGLQSRLEPINLNLAEHQRLRRELSLPLQYHDPYPAVLVDQLGDIALFNRSWLNLLSLGGPIALNFPDRANLLDMYFATVGMRQNILDWEQFACVVLLRTKEQQILTGNERIGKLIEWLEAYEGVPENWALRGREDEKRNDSNYRFSLSIGEQNLAWKVVVLGAEPMRSNAASTLLMHQFFPANAATRALFQSKAAKEKTVIPDDERASHRLLCHYEN